MQTNTQLVLVTQQMEVTWNSCVIHKVSQVNIRTESKLFHQCALSQRRSHRI